MSYRSYFFEPRCLDEKRGMQNFWNFHINVRNESIDITKKYFHTFSFIDIEDIEEWEDTFGGTKGSMTLVVPDDDTRLVFEILADLEFVSL